LTVTASTARSSGSWETWTPAAKLALAARLRNELWRRQARPEQIPTEGDWLVFLMLGGRGAGKTRAGAETLASWILDNDPGEWAIVAPTYADARDVCVEGPSGLLRALGGTVTKWNRSVGQVEVANGSVVFLDGADDGAYRIQGHNLSGAWGDEVGLWAKNHWQTAWQESLQFALRVAPARIVATGTPKGARGLVKLLLDDDRVLVSRMRTLDNAENLHPAALAELLRRYEGTRLGRQELEAEVLEDVEGALWTLSQIDARRVEQTPSLQRIIVGVDPNVSSAEGSNNAGIIVAGRDASADSRGFVLADRTVTAGGPRAWAKAAVDAYYEFSADRIVAEKNNGGEMVELTIHTVDSSVPVKLVSASRGKRVRAEPISALYESSEANPLGRVFHVGVFGELETEMTQWTPESESPDRMDALVWALTELLLGPTRAMRSHVPRGRIPTATDRMSRDTLLGGRY
jgi:phage terminase large subunit-like protein